MDSTALFSVIAETATEGSHYGNLQSLVPIDFIWGQISALSWIQAIIAISFGAVYLLYGCKIFKILVVIAFSLIGMTIGIRAGQFMPGSNWQIWGGVAGAVLLGSVSIPLMRWAVSILGAIAGGIITTGIWYAFDLPDNHLILAGALIGMIAGGMLSFVVFDAAVVLFTSLNGAALVVMGLLALFLKYEPTSNDVHNWVYNYKWFLPAAIITTTVVGILIQKQVMKSKDS